MKSFEWNKATQSFDEVDNPTYFPDIGSVDESIAKANYHQEISSYDGDSTGATVQVYATDDETKPRFFIDIMGMNCGIASLVARDFPSLVETLRQVHPLLTLIGLDQFNSARISDQIRRESKKN